MTPLEAILLAALVAVALEALRRWLHAMRFLVWWLARVRAEIAFAQKRYAEALEIFAKWRKEFEETQVERPLPPTIAVGLDIPDIEAFLIDKAVLIPVSVLEKLFDANERLRNLDDLAEFLRRHTIALSISGFDEAAYCGAYMQQYVYILERLPRVERWADSVERHWLVRLLAWSPRFRRATQDSQEGPGPKESE